MVRVCGVNIPSNKVFVFALTYIYGVGKPRATYVCKKLNIDLNVRAKDVSGDVLMQVSNFIVKQENDADPEYKSKYVLTTEGDLRRKNTMDIKRLVEIKSYRGMRHTRGLPCRGQRTHTNARTRKGRKAGSIPNKKK